MPALLPLLSLVLLFGTFHRRGGDARRAALAAAVTMGLLVVAGSELLSLVDGVHRGGLTLFWGVVAAALVVLLRKLSRAAAPVEPRRRPRGAAALLAAGIGVTLAGTLITALAATPNNWDSMTYHLTRVLHWAELDSVHHFATHSVRHLYNPPFAEWALLHLQELSGGDRLANLVQWLSFAGTLAAVSVVAEELGAGRRGRLFAVVFAASIPMAVLQATSTQNDLVAGFWLLAFLAFALPLRHETRWANVLLAAAACGLVVLTKATAATFALPFVIWLGLAALARERGAAWRPGLVFVIVVLAVNGGHWLRNVRLFEHPLGSDVERARFTNADIGAAALYSNAVRMAAIHLQTPSPSLNRQLEDAVTRLHHLAGLDVDPPGTAFHDLPFALDPRWREENNAGAPLHTLLALATALLLAAAARAPAERPAALYAAVAVASFVLYTTLVRWQPTSVRLLLPLLLVWGPPVGRLLGVLHARRAAAGLGVALLLISWGPVFANEYRPLFGPRSVFVTPRFEQYFASRPWELASQRRDTERLAASGCTRVALTVRENSYEYPYRMMVQALAERPVHFRHHDVRNESAPLALPFEPCARVKLFGGRGRNRLVIRGSD